GYGTPLSTAKTLNCMKCRQREPLQASGYTEVPKSGTRQQSQELVGRDSCRPPNPRILERPSGHFGGRDRGSACLSAGRDQGSGDLQGSGLYAAEGCARDID